MAVAASWSVGILIVSAIAALGGLSWLLYTAHQEEKHFPLREYSPQEAYGETLWRMIFVYWLVYCGARGLQIAVPLEGTDFGQMCKLQLSWLFCSLPPRCCVYPCTIGRHASASNNSIKA